MKSASTWGTWNDRATRAQGRVPTQNGTALSADVGGLAEAIGVSLDEDRADALGAVVKTGVIVEKAVSGDAVIDLRPVRTHRDVHPGGSTMRSADDTTTDLVGLESLDLDESALLEASTLADGQRVEEAVTDEIFTRPPLELHEIHPYVQCELAALDIQVKGNDNPIYRICKRAIDLIVAVPLLVLVSPIIGLLSLAIRLESGGPAVFRQQRVGEDGRVFTFYKFRTMYVDAKERFPELYDYDFETSELSSRYYKHANDPRNTRLGAIIRQTTLDELPNLFNVVKGDTSLVGPRPELPEMIRHYQPSQLVKFTVKPGLTGLAACTGRNTLTIDEQIRADVEYVAGQTMKMDIWIMAETAKMIVKSVGAE